MLPSSSDEVEARMKYCVMYNLRFETPAQGDKLVDDVKLKISGKGVWAETAVTKGEEEGYPTRSFAVWFDSEVDMNELFEFVKDRMERIPVLKGSRVSKHFCTHDESTPQPCVIKEEHSR
ncbi:hypothetical protein M1N57_00300 [Dehalococcoidales bacterium]|nr:hypothetical protein [Dehalococcoidales bacterium]